MKSKKNICLIFSYIIVVVFIYLAVSIFLYWQHLIKMGHDQVDIREFYQNYASDYLE